MTRRAGRVRKLLKSYGLSRVESGGQEVMKISRAGSGQEMFEISRAGAGLRGCQTLHDRSVHPDPARPTRGVTRPVQCSRTDYAWRERSLRENAFLEMA